MHPLVLEAVEPALGRRVVPAAPFPAHRVDPAVRLELVLKGMAGEPLANPPPASLIYFAAGRETGRCGRPFLA
jgi:hypothetical protein